MARRGKHGLPKYVTPARDRHGTVRLRFRKGAFSTYLTAKRDTDEFWQQYQAALDGLKTSASQIGATRHRPGTIAATVISYYASPEFLGLADTTKGTYRGILNRFVLVHGSKPIASLERHHIKAIIGGMADRPHAANNLLRMLRLLLDFAVDSEIITRNPAHKLRGFRVRSDGFPTWSEDEIAAFERRHPIGTRARLAMSLLLYTGQRRGDVVRLGWQHVNDEDIVVSQGKTGEKLTLRMHRALLEALDHTPRTNMTFLVTEQGAPFTPAGFGNWFREMCDQAGVTGRSAHGLRKAAARRLADAGNSTKRIQAVTGHRTLSEVERYTRAADQKKLAGEAVASMPDRSDREQNSPNPSERLDKKKRKALK